MRTSAREGLTRPQLLRREQAHSTSRAGCHLVRRAAVSNCGRRSGRQAAMTACAASLTQPSAGTPSMSTKQSEDDGVPLLSMEQLERIAESGGRRLRLQTLGPFYRISCCSNGTEPKPLGVSSGFIVSALQLMHCDTLEVFANRPGGLATAEERHAALGVGLLLRTAVFAHGHACGCTKAEILAINDDDHTHRRLVAYYRRMGFTVEHEMEGGRLSDLPHLLVWGGLGTRMNGSVQKLLRRWSKALLAQSPQAKDVSTPTL